MTRQASTLTPTSPSGLPDTRLSGWRLKVARAVMFIILALTIIVGLVALPGLLPRFATPCADALNSCILTPQQVAPLARLGITPYSLALGIVGLTCLSVLLVDGVVAVLLWRRSDDWMALLVTLTLALEPTVFTPGLQGLSGFWHAIAQALDFIGVLILFLLIGIFPSGRFVPRWLWLLLLAVALFVAFAGPNLPPLFSLIPILITVLSLIASQVYRYRRVSTPAQRQQTKWAVYGLILALFVNQVFWQTYSGIPALHQPDSLYSLLIYPDSFLIIVILASFFSLAILRSHLFDIDVIIRRTLIYGTLTVVLAALYISVVVGLQALVGSVNSAASHSPALIVASTLLIAWLFTPLRRGIQTTIDRRFYRRKYDATKTLAAFGATVRTETDLDSLSGHLVSAVQETMQPEHVSLWLVQPQPPPHPQFTESPLHGEMGRRAP